MKTILTALLFPLSFTALAQMPGKAVDEYKTALGTVLHPGDTLHLGRGSNPNGKFVYAYVPAKAFGGPRVYFDSSWANGQTVIKELRYQEAKRGGGHRTIAIVKTNTINGVVELDQAEEVRELLTTASKATTTSGPVSVADELKKLKGLLDSGVITQAEFDTQKARLLK